jgi:hypothetical protein
MERLSEVRIPDDHLLTDHTHDGSVKDKLFHMNRSMRTNTMTWAGIAAGAGFGLGLAGRIMRHRAKVPHIVIIESA